MNRRIVLIALATLAVLAVVVTLVSRRGGEGGPGTAETETAAADQVDAAGSASMPATLYFPGTGSWLVAEGREVPAGETVAQQITAVVEALLAGPQNSGLRSPLPGSVMVHRTYLVDGGTVYLSLESADGAPPPASGSTRELLTVYSLVNTVLLNFDQVESVVLLWNGHQLKTFAGHLDTRRPLLARADLVAQTP